ncbi:thioredoxin domain-containing protein [Palleronia pelagia]|uniref:Regulatory protein SoxS n=1 Tax=Palleronia pelagia TaxID=387096 RepID=A0A1H8LP84_9RHOB|nr:hypothetical protein [Palleronia pelagia]SEO06929.1 hypothetical protein SAMN04488011_11132 [Palleronia pelagia]
MRLPLLATCLGLLTALPAWAERELVMVEQHGCVWCERWDAEIAPAYPKTEIGAEAPLRRIDLNAPVPVDLTLASPPRLTPTFILIDDGDEIARLEGYPGEDFFWAVIERMLSDAGPVAGSPEKHPR